MAKREPLSDKIAIDMTPMIDVVFQLITFFMLTLKTVITEGDFDIRMPLGASAGAAPEDAPTVLRLVMKADGEGRLAKINMNGNPIVGDDLLSELATGSEALRQAEDNAAKSRTEGTKRRVDAATKQKNAVVRQFIDTIRGKVNGVIGGGTGPGGGADNTEAEIDADPGLQYEHVVYVITAVSGKETADGQTVPLIKKIKFAPPKKQR
ncbi:MAG: biopolymer transporter ExbD [Planctomycetota bacterium]|nr:MAG: biopolymer transporter ExbD [Planctomycetota bacterium]